MFCHVALKVSDPSQVGEVRRLANRLAIDAGLDETTRGRLAIVATELSTNLSRYAPGGEVLLRASRLPDTPGFELLAIDRGPGMANLAQCLHDGFSTGGTPGTGLGASQRLSSEFDMFSAVGQGTVILSRIAAASTPVGTRHFDWGVINRSAPNEVSCGDTWRIAEWSDELRLMVADGLGHGPQAADAAAVAASVFEEHRFATLSEYLVVADRRMHGTRGAAVAVAHIRANKTQVRFVGVGNIAATLRARESTGGQGLVSHNGIVGAQMRKVQEFDYDCFENSLLVMYSDGLQSRWSLDAYPGLMNRHPAVIAGVLYRDFTRGRDDVTVCVVRVNKVCTPK